MKNYLLALMTLTFTNMTFASTVLDSPLFCTSHGEPGPMNAIVTVHEFMRDSYNFVLYGGPVRFEETEEGVSFEVMNGRYHRKLVLNSERTRGSFYFNFTSGTKSDVTCKSYEGQRIVVAVGYSYYTGETVEQEQDAVDSCKGPVEAISNVESSYHYHTGTTTYRQAFRCL